jgi:hypothetical protein
VTPVLTSAFNLPEHLSAKDDRALIARDEVHFAAIRQCLEESMAAPARRCWSATWRSTD